MNPFEHMFQNYVPQPTPASEALHLFQDHEQRLRKLESSRPDMSPSLAAWETAGEQAAIMYDTAKAADIMSQAKDLNTDMEAWLLDFRSISLSLHDSQEITVGDAKQALQPFVARVATWTKELNFLISNTSN